MNQNCAYHLYECIFTGKISVEKLTPWKETGEGEKVIFFLVWTV